jgi:hypothetical protein
MSPRFLFASTAMAVALSTSAVAAPVVLNFEGINASYPSGFAQVLDFYNGGLSGDLTTGTNYGVSFDSNALAICLNSDTVQCSNTSRGGLAPGSSQGGLFFTTGSSTVLDYAAGFDTGFSFFYAQPNSAVGNVQVFDGLGATGALLGQINLASTPSSCSGGFAAGYCPFVAAGLNFNGTARSISFNGVANFVVFDDVTFGSSTPGIVPEPSTWAISILGLGLAGSALRSARRRKMQLA